MPIIIMKIMLTMAALSSMGTVKNSQLFSLCLNDQDNIFLSTEKDTFLSSDGSTYMMMPGDSYQPVVYLNPHLANGNLNLAWNMNLAWSSSDSSVASVDEQGRIEAKKDGRCSISCAAGQETIYFSINVISESESTSPCHLTLLTGSPSKERNYDLFHQSAHNYSSYNSYLAWHGCAHCSLATVLGAYNEAYSGIKPNEIIDGIEKKYVDASDWSREHEKHSLKHQMPLSLYGISTLLTKANVNNEYIPSFNYDEARADILNYLKSGNPVIIEVRKKNALTGKSSTRWTGSLHTMIFLGVYTDGEHVLLCDSVNRSWYEGGQRYKIVTIDDVMAYMFSSTESSDSMYYDGVASDGGYIKIFD